MPKQKNVVKFFQMGLIHYFEYVPKFSNVRIPKINSGTDLLVQIMCWIERIIFLSLVSWLEHVIFPFALIMPNIYYWLVYNPWTGFMSIALASLIEGHWRTFNLWLFVIGFNPYNFYMLLYIAPAYCNISIFPHLGY